MNDSTDGAGWVLLDRHGRPVTVGRTPDKAEAIARAIGAMPIRGRFERVTTEARYLALKLTLPEEETDVSESEPVRGWIVYGPDGRPVAAGPTLDGACDTAAAVGQGEGGYSPLPATEAELDALDLPSRALGIREGGRPWWRDPEAPDGPRGPAGPRSGRRGCVRAVDPRLDPCGGRRRACLSRDRALGRVSLPRAHLFRHSGRERCIALRDRAGVCRGPAPIGTFQLPIIENADSTRDEYLPEYPRCPECGGRIASGEAERVLGSRRCEGERGLIECPACDGQGGGLADDPAGDGAMVECEVCDGTGNLGPDGCGSTFLDTRFGEADPVPGGET